MQQSVYGLLSLKDVLPCPLQEKHRPLTCEMVKLHWEKAACFAGPVMLMVVTQPGKALPDHFPYFLCLLHQCIFLLCFVCPTHLIQSLSSNVLMSGAGPCACFFFSLM